MNRLALSAFALILISSTARPATPPESLEARTARRAQEIPLTLLGKKPNEIKTGKFSYSGIAVQVANTENRFQLLNPAAPPEYGEAELNVVREPAGGKVSGLKIFSIQF